MTLFTNAKQLMKRDMHGQPRRSQSKDNQKLIIIMNECQICKVDIFQIKLSPFTMFKYKYSK